MALYYSNDPISTVLKVRQLMTHWHYTYLAFLCIRSTSFIYIFRLAHTCDVKRQCLNVFLKWEWSRGFSGTSMRTKWKKVYRKCGYTDSEKPRLARPLDWDRPDSRLFLRHNKYWQAQSYLGTTVKDTRTEEEIRRLWKLWNFPIRIHKVLPEFSFTWPSENKDRYTCERANKVGR